MQRPLGKTGLRVSPVAFGAFKIGRNEKIKYAQSYPLPGEEDAGKLLNGVLDLGINLIDTAPAYGVSEERIGRHVAHRREQFLLSSKVGETFENGVSTYDFSGESARRSVERSLTRLRADHLDFLFIHSDGRDVQILKEGNLLETLEALKREGKARFIGLSGKTVQGARQALAWADALMVEYHPDDPSHAPVIEEAGQRGVAVLVKKPLASGKLAAAEAIPFCLTPPAVASLVIGGLNLKHIEQNLAIANR